MSSKLPGRPGRATPRRGACNALIAAMTDVDRARLLALSSDVSLADGMTVCRQGQRMDCAYFPVSGAIGLLSAVSPRPPLALGLVGREGMLGPMLSLGSRIAIVDGVTQGPMRAWRVDAGNLVTHLAGCPRIGRLVADFQHALLIGLLRAGVCTCVHELRPRLARWLLMSSDRPQAGPHKGRIELTHQRLADGLGVRRSAVTLAAGSLQSEGLIRYRRGGIGIVSRAGLRAVACGCYRAIANGEGASADWR